MDKDIGSAVAELQVCSTHYAMTIVSCGFHSPQSLMNADLQHCLLADQNYLLNNSNKNKGSIIEETTRKRFQSARNLQTSLKTHPESAITRYGLGYAGFGNGWTALKPKILFPSQKRRVKGRFTFPFSRRSNLAQSKLPVDLVPIRLEIDADRYKLRDSFTWNLYDKCISLDQFAEQICIDYDIPLHNVHIVQNISKSIQAQINDYEPRKAQSNLSFVSDVSSSTSETVYAHEPSDSLAKASKQQIPTVQNDLRILIKLDITIGRLNLIDQFEWNLFAPESSAEEFATVMCLDLGLSGEFCTAVAHSIREQCQMYIKYLSLIGYLFDGSEIEDEEVRSYILPPLKNTLRFSDMESSSFAPMIYELNDAEMERQDRGYDREARRMRRRQGRAKHGIMLPDLRDIPKIHRSLFPSSSVPSDDDFMHALSLSTNSDGETLNEINTNNPEREHLIVRLKVDSQKLKIIVEQSQTLTLNNFQQRKLTPLPNSMSFDSLNEFESERNTPSTYGQNISPLPQFSSPSLSSDAFLTNSNSSESALVHMQKLNLPDFTPSWVKRCVIETFAKFPNDRFNVIVKPALNPAERMTVRICCHDCINEYFTAGPGFTFGNFHIHLLSSSHQQKKEVRMNTVLDRNT